MILELAPRLEAPDALFAALLAAHDGLEEAASRKLDAALVLLLANHIGDQGVIVEAIGLAREAIPGKEAAP